MTLHLFAGCRALRRLHLTVYRNLSLHFQHSRRGERARYHFNTRNASTSTSSRQNWTVLDTLSLPFRGYSNMQARSPLLTQFESALVIYFLGDLSAQTVGSSFFSEAPYEPIRGLRMMTIAAISCIPSYKWFIWLGKNFNYSNHWVSIGVKILVNQTFFTPVFNTYFFGMQSLLSGCSWTETKRRVRDTVPVSFVNSWRVWPAVTAFSFTYLRPQTRPVFAGCIAVVWQTYLSWLNKSAEVKERCNVEEVGQDGEVMMKA